MEYRSFKKLCTIINGKILVNDEMAQVRTGKEGITVEIMLHCLLRWLAGGSYIDIRLSTGISPSYFYTSVYKCMDAILGSEESSYKFPSTAKELEEAAQGFELLSTQADDSKVVTKKIVVGDNAYIYSETLLTPFSSVEKEDPAKDAFNF